MKYEDRFDFYRIFVSISFGLIGFVMNFLPINFYFTNHTASFLLGLIFPMIITLAWGWKYGFISATLGLGCQTMWFLWMPKSGWGPFISVPLFTFWILWHGYWQNSEREYKGLLKNPFIIEIPFRVFNIIILYTVFIWIFQFNPAPWAPLAKSYVPIDYVNFVALKELINGYIILLITHVLFNLSVIRKIMKLKENINQENTNYIISGSILIGLLFWVFDGFLSYFIFESGQGTFLDLMILKVPAHIMLVRFVFVLTIMIGGLLISIYLRRQRTCDIKCGKAYIRVNFYKDILSHDIRNILQSIQTSTEIIKKNLNIEENGFIAETLGIVEAQINRGDKLVSTVKKISEIEETEYYLKPIEALDVLNTSIENIKYSLDKKTIDVQIDSYEKQIQVKANEFLLDVFDNILINAMTHNNNLEIKILVKISKEQKVSKSYIKFEFTDNGKGIPDNKKEIVFQRACIKEGTIKGMGMGLSLVKKILEKYQGEIWVEDNVKDDYSKGSKFILLIPEVK